jgi:hypothetical protein
MPSTSEKQREAMAIAEHHPEKLHKENKGMLKMSHQQLHDFASTKGLHKKGTGGAGGSPVKFIKREGCLETHKEEKMDKGPQSNYD